jgi:hypothetical protein
MSCVRTEEGDVMIVALPPTGMNAAEARQYLHDVRQQIEGIIAKRQSSKAIPGTMYRIDLENGQRGGWFYNSSQALTALLWETIEFARTAKTQPRFLLPVVGGSAGTNTADNPDTTPWRPWSAAYDSLP